MILVLLALAASLQPENVPQPYPFGAHSTSEGAKLTVARLFDVTRAKNDAAYDKIARGIVIMLAPDMAMPVSRAKFEEVFSSCKAPRIVSSRPFPKVPEVQAVRISMECTDKDHPKPVDATADIMADDEHAFMIFPGSAERVLPARIEH